MDNRLIPPARHKAHRRNMDDRLIPPGGHKARHRKMEKLYQEKEKKIPRSESIPFDYNNVYTQSEWDKLEWWGALNCVVKWNPQYREVIHITTQVKREHDIMQRTFVIAIEIWQRLLKDIDTTNFLVFKTVLSELVKATLDWIDFITSDCIVSQTTYQWAFEAFMFVILVTGDGRILDLDESNYQQLRRQSSRYVSDLIQYGDISLEQKHGTTLPIALRDSTNSFAATLVKLEANLNREHGPADSLDTSKTIELVPISKPWLPALGEAIGRGASGTVHLATNLLDGYPIAVKKITIEMPNQTNQSPPLSTQIQRTATQIQRTATEIVMLEKHLHKNIVLYQSATLHSNVVLILMEYCAGGSLASFLKIPNVMPNEKAVQGWTFELLGGLKCLHDSGFIHGDIKPDNIMFSQDLTLKYVDFGSSRRITGSEKNFSGGTPRYMSPEAINGSRVAAIDVWSLGCVVLEMVTGHLPWEKQFPVGNEQSLMYHVGQGKAGAPPLPTSKQLGPPGIDFLEQCFKLDPEMRSTVHELLDHEWIKGS